MTAAPERFPCPCCGYLVLDEPGVYEICPICFREDDPTQLRFVTLRGGANKRSPVEAQKIFPKHGACESRLLPHVRPPAGHERRDPGWRPFDPATDIAEAAEIGRTYVEHAFRTDEPEVTTLYYSRRLPQGGGE